MRRLAIFTLLYICVCYCCAQKYRYPVFDRTDEPRLHIDSVEFTKDSTFLYFTYEAEGNSWAQISGCTYLEELTTGMRYKILDAKGIPFNPSRRRFEAPSTIKVVLCFPPTKRTIFNLIEDENEKAFNIYGINLSRLYSKSFSAEDIHFHFNASHEKQKEEDWRSAIDHTLQQLEASNFIEGIRSLASASSMFNLTLVYHGLREYENMIEWGKRAIDILHVLPQDSLTLDILARTYSNIGTAYHMLKKHEMGQQYQELSLATRRFEEGIGVLSYEEYLRNLANSYYYEDNYPKALLYGREVADIYKMKFAENNSAYGCAYASSLANLCQFSQRMDKVEDAIYSGNTALGIVNSGACTDSLVTLHIYCNLAGALAMKKDFDEAVTYLETVLSEKYKDIPDYSRIEINTRMLLADIFLDARQDSLAAIKEYEQIHRIISDNDDAYYSEHAAILEKLYHYYSWRAPDLSIRYLKELIKLQGEWNGEESVAYGNTCYEYVSNPHVITKTIKDTTERENYLYYLNKSSDIFKRHISSSVYNMSREDRKAYWNRYENLYTWLIPTSLSLLGVSEKTNSLAYDAALFYKGMLLSSEMEFKNIVQTSHDNALINLYNDYIKNCILLEAPNMRPTINIDSINRETQYQEYLLSQRATRFNKQYMGTNLSWKEVQATLNIDDVAIEFVSYPNVNETEILYDAYLIDINSSAPIILPLFDESQLKGLIRDGEIDAEGLSRLIWGNLYLDNALRGKKNVFFSASGLLCTIAIEYLPIDKSSYICDKFNLYRLSSTRELCYSNNDNQPSNVCLFGGLDYECTTSESIDSCYRTTSLPRSITDTIANRGGFDPLFGSQQEVLEVAQELTQSHVKYKVFSNDEGTEAAFKKLSGSDFDIIHLSTHGMYVSLDKPLEGSRGYSFILSDDVPVVDEEAASLSRSFLVMSGGNTIIYMDSIADGEEDGILTALEISHLDFSHLDLVVLSACETALGIVDSEGVYGLQRGFKKAGANAIIMSLGKVDDEATRILMVEFYKNLLSGKSKHQSLRDAQKYLRQVDNGKYDDPKYWASFILLDGLN